MEATKAALACTMDVMKCFGLRLNFKQNVLLIHVKKNIFTFVVNIKKSIHLPTGAFNNLIVSAMREADSCVSKIKDR